MNDPLISVCVANYNGMDVIDECIQSVLAQRCAVSMEVLVHDDASTDGSVAHLRRQYPEILLLESADNVGFCVANNRMVARARGQYVLLLNNDAVLLPDALATLLAEAQHHQQPAILTLPQYDYASGDLVDRGCLLDPFYNPIPNLNPERSDVAMVIGACLWIDKTLWDELQGFPEWFGSIAEDMFLCCRARWAGYATRSLQVSGYRHWQGKSFGGNRPRDGRLVSTFARRALSERNKTFAMLMTCPVGWVWIVLPIHLSLLMMEGTLLSVMRLNARHLTQIYLPVLVAVLKRRRLLFGQRKAIQQVRRTSTRQFLTAFVPYPQKLRLLWKHGFPKIA